MQFFSHFLFLGDAGITAHTAEKKKKCIFHLI